MTVYYTTYRELLQCHSSCLRPRLLRREKLTSSVGPSIQRGRKNTFLWSALDSPVPHMLEDCGRS